MTDDDLADLVDDDEDDDDDATGAAAVLHWTDGLGVRIEFAASVDDAAHLAARDPCPVDSCLGGHAILARDGQGQVRTLAETTADGDQVLGRFSNLLRARERRRIRDKHRYDADRLRRRRAAKRAALERRREEPE